MGNVQKNEFNISGRVVHVGMPDVISDRLSKRTIVIEVYKEKYRNEVVFDFINDNMSCLNGMKEKDWVCVDFVLTGKKSMGKNGKFRWFNNLEGVSCVKQ